MGAGRRAAEEKEEVVVQKEGASNAVKHTTAVIVPSCEEDAIHGGLDLGQIVGVVLDGQRRQGLGRAVVGGVELVDVGVARRLGVAVGRVGAGGR